MRLTRLLAISSLIVIAAAAACSKHATEPPPPPLVVSPLLVATEPPARAQSSLYDTEIWGEFDRDLDPATVDVQTAFLKLDGQRIPTVVTYVAATRRIALRPTVVLLLQRTYTVEFTPAIHATDGVPLPPNVFFQFTTNSLRRVSYDFPVQDTLVGPLNMLGWGGSQGPVNEITFTVYAGTDSGQVARREIPPIHANVFTRYLPFTAWPRGARVYWAVDNENLVTHERLEGPVHKFRVFDENVAVETVRFYARDHGSRSLTSTTQFCNSQDMPASPSHNTALHWDVGQIPPGAHVVSAKIGLAVKVDPPRLPTPPAFSLTEPTLYMTQTEWINCSMNAPGPPYPEVNGVLATATEDPNDPLRVEFTSDRLGAFFEAVSRGDIYTHGTLLKTRALVYYHSSVSQDGPRQPFAEIRYIQAGTK